MGCGSANKMTQFTFIALIIAALTGMTTRAVEGKGIRTWKEAHATFYGPPEGTMGGGCGYGQESQSNFGTQTTALSSVLYNSGDACGSCYQLKCDFRKTEKWCRRGQKVTVTATDLCPPDYSKPNDNGGWCNPPLAHFDMSQPAYLQIAIYEAGIVPVLYRRVRCPRNGGVRFKISGNQFYNLVLITNVGGSGDLIQVWVKSSTDTQWQQMTRNWGSNWQTKSPLNGQALSFRLVSSSGRIRILPNAVPSGWQFGQTYEATAQL